MNSTYTQESCWQDWAIGHHLLYQELSAPISSMAVYCSLWAEQTASLLVELPANYPLSPYPRFH